MGEASDSQSAKKAERSRGRPRSEEAHRAILGATLELLGEVGYDGLSIEAVATRAGVGRPTIYRRWKNKEELVAEALDIARPHFEMPDSGSLRSDLDWAINAMAQVAGDAKIRRLLMLTLSEVSMNERLRETWWSRYVLPRFEMFGEVMRRAVARGELDAATDVGLLLHLLSASMIYRFFIVPGWPDRAELWKSMDFILSRAGAPGAAPAP